MEKTEISQKLTIGSVAKLSNVGVETVRFYERKGIIEQPPKTSGFRVYPEEVPKQIRFVKKMQDLGFDLEEIKDFLYLTSCTGDPAKIVREKSDQKRDEIKNKIEDLTRVLQALDKFAACCGSRKCKSDCELLECFENDWDCCSP